MIEVLFSIKPCETLNEEAAMIRSTGGEVQGFKAYTVKRNESVSSRETHAFTNGGVTELGEGAHVLICQQVA